MLMESQVKVIVFDLDFTLWDAGGLWCDCTNPPYRKTKEGRVFDFAEREIRLYTEVIEILETLQSRDYELALASRTEKPDWANELTRLLGVDLFVNYREIYPGSKITHLTRISETSGAAFSEIIFFDDESRNIVEAESIGVSSVLVPNGINRELVLDALALRS